MRRGRARTHFTWQWRLSGNGPAWFRAALLPGAAWLTVENANAQSSTAGEGAASASAPVSIWYRSSEGCPDGATFLSRLDELGRSARLASVGDRVDFVVTLAAASGASSGRLERQTERGTVAIRDVQANQCTEVAEALALSLDLALEPGPGHTGAARGEPPPLQPGPALVPAPEARAPEVAVRPEPREVADAPIESPLGLGLQGTLTSGLSPGFSGGAALFLELGAAARDPSARLSAHGSYSLGTSDDERLGTTLLAARLEGCAFSWDGGPWSIRPCVGVDGGFLSSSWLSEGGYSDRGPWFSALGLVRMAVPISPHFVPEAQVAGVIPFTRYVMGSPLGVDVFQIEPILLQVSVGARWAL